jgi:hypothetical protein
MSALNRDELLTLLNAAIRAEKDRKVLDDPYMAIERLLEAREKLNEWIEELEEKLIDAEGERSPEAKKREAYWKS